MRAAYRIWMSILTAAVVVQIAFAGYGAFYAASKLTDEGSSINDSTFEDGFGLHAGLGYPIVLGILIAVILALLARPGARTVWLTALAFGLGIVQIILAWTGGEWPAVGAFHPVNALVILGLLGSLTGREWRLARGRDTAAPAATVPPA